MGKRIFICLFSLFVICYLLFVQKSVSAVCLFLLCKILLLYSKWNKVNLLLGYIVSIVIVIAFHEYNIDKYGNYYFQGSFSDDYRYEMESMYFYEDYGLNFSRIYDTIGILHNSAGYVYVLALLRGFGSVFDGYNVFLPKILNVFVLQLVAYYAFIIGVKMYGFPPKRVGFITLILSIYPVSINIASNIFRDTLVSLFFVFVFYLLNQKKQKCANVVLAFVVCVVLFFFRAFASYMLLLLTVLYLCKIKNISQFISIFFVVLFLIIWQFNDVLGRAFLKVEGYNELNGERFGGIGRQIFSSPLYYGFFPRVTFMVLNPLPNLSNLQSVFSGISCFLQIFYIPFVWKALINRRVDIKLKITFVVLFLGVTLSSANFRHITMYLPFAFLLLMCGCDYLRFNTKSYYVLLFSSLVFYVVSLSLILV